MIGGYHVQFFFKERKQHFELMGLAILAYTRQWYTNVQKFDKIFIINIFRNDALIWLKVTVFYIVTCVFQINAVLLNFLFNIESWHFVSCFHKINADFYAEQAFLTLIIIRNIYWVLYLHIRIISEGSSHSNTKQLLKILIVFHNIIL